MQLVFPQCSTQTLPRRCERHVRGLGLYESTLLMSCDSPELEDNTSVLMSRWGDFSTISSNQWYITYTFPPLCSLN